ncbi:MAG: hypothetical protein KKG10_00655 [Proteobacteria bacterium]|nr:hypothetical protein [Pseudomonadota bacterium]
MPARIEDLKRLLPVETYNTITAGSHNNPGCRERNREQLDLSDLPNGQWYYTYDNLIRGMAQLKEFANEGDENTNVSLGTPLTNWTNLLRYFYGLMLWQQLVVYGTSINK